MIVNAGEHHFEAVQRTVNKIAEIYNATRYGTRFDGNGIVCHIEGDEGCENALRFSLEDRGYEVI